MEEALTKKSFIKIFISSFVIGGIVFIVIFGIHVLNPLADDWIQQMFNDWTLGDTIQHYYGWCYYRNSPWGFPLGLISNMTTDDISIIYTDSMPIVAVIFKLLSPILPETFHYFGICSFLAFALNGAWGGVLLRKGIKNDYVCIALSIVFVLAPSMITTAFLATSLLGQWTIIAALCLWFYSPLRNKWQNILMWCGLIVISMGLHLYIGAMVLGIFVFAVISDVVKEKKLLFSLIKLVSGILSAFLYLYVFGFFSGDYERGTEYYTGGDILVLLKPTSEGGTIGGYLIGSKLLGATQLPWCGYVGFGIIVGVIICIVLYIISLVKKGKNIQISIGKANFILCIILMLGCYFFTITPNTYFNNHLIFSFELPDILSKLYSWFRVNTRFTWPIMYLIYYFVMVGVYRFFSKEYIAVIILSCICVLQIVDSLDIICAARNRLESDVVYESRVTPQIEKMIKDHELVYLKDKWGQGLGSPDFQEYWDIVACCLENNALVSNYYLARNNEKVLEYENKLYEDLQQGVAHNEVLYVFRKEELEGKNYPLTIYDAENGFCFGYVQ